MADFDTISKAVHDIKRCGEGAEYAAIQALFPEDAKRWIVTWARGKSDLVNRLWCDFCMEDRPTSHRMDCVGVKIMNVFGEKITIARHGTARD